MTYALRPYQQEAVSSAVRHLQGGKGNGLLVLPTGSGKSLVIAGIARELGRPLLVFQPSKEILEQNAEKLRAYGFEPAVFSASCNSKEVGRVTLATIGSAAHAPEQFTGFQDVIIDECHRVNSKEGQFKALLDFLAGARVLGLTATPYRLTKDGYGGSILKFLTRTRPRVFSEVVHVTQGADLWRDGFLAPLVYKTNELVDRSKLRLNSTGADFDDASVKSCYQEHGFSAKLADLVGAIATVRKNALVFTRFVEEARFVSERVHGAAIVTAETPAGERARLIEDFRQGAVRVVCNVGVLTTGFDYPELCTVVLARPTRSLSLFYQMIGRGLRPHPEKDHCTVVDLCGNVKTFGRVEDLVLDPGTNGKWAVRGTEGRQLTNVYFDKPEIEIPRGASPKLCGGCKATIYWVRTLQGKWTPVNPDKTSHWGTCPERKKFKRERSAA